MTGWSPYQLLLMITRNPHSPTGTVHLSIPFPLHWALHLSLVVPVAKAIVFSHSLFALTQLLVPHISLHGQVQFVQYCFPFASPSVFKRQQCVYCQGSAHEAFASLRDRVQLVCHFAELPVLLLHLRRTLPHSVCS